MTAIDPLYIQFGSSDWFRDMIPNTYVVQLEPQWGVYQGSVIVKIDEAIHLEQLRDRFFMHLEEIALRNDRLTVSRRILISRPVDRYSWIFS
jgi:hypothetical protein